MIRRIISVILHLPIQILRSSTFWSIIFTLLVLCIIELGARRYWGENQKYQSWLYDWNNPDLVLHHKFKPNRSFRETTRSIPITSYTNTQSWFEKYDVSKEKPLNVYRIFYVGDSTVGGAVSHDDKMVKLVEKTLNQTYANTGRKFEIINTGNTSYSPILYLLRIKTELLQYKPDLIIINIDMTDIVNDVAYRKTAVFDQNGWPIAVRPSSDVDKGLYKMTPNGVMKISQIDSMKENIHQFLISRSVALYQTEKFVQSNFSRSGPSYTYQSADYSANWLLHEWTPEITENVGYSMNLLTHTFSLLKGASVKVALTCTPHLPQFSGEWSILPIQTLASTASSSGVPFLNTYDEMVKTKISENIDYSQYYWKEDPTHFNIEGNRLWAEFQVKFLTNPEYSLL